MKTSENGWVKLESNSGISIWHLYLPYVESVSMGIMVRIGSRDEASNEAGLSHATEHMVFQGTKRFSTSRALSSYIELVGGDANADTSEERTFFYNQLPAKEAERGFRALSEMTQLPIFPPKKIQSEMKSIVQEMKMHRDDPDSHVFELFQENVYGAHPLGKLIIGSEESVSSFKQENFFDFISRYYNPLNFTIIVVGNILGSKALKLCNKYFSANLSVGKKNARIDTEYAKPANRELVVARDIEQSHVVLGCTTTKATDKDSLALSMFQTMISGGMSFPLFQEVRDKKGLCYHVSAHSEMASDLGCFLIYVGTSDVNKAIKAILEVVQKSKNSEKLFKCAKKLWFGRMALTSKNDDDILETAVDDILYFGQPRTREERIERINSVTLKEVEAAVNKYLSLDRMVMVMIVPKK